jgi:hypothetical protein
MTVLKGPQPSFDAGVPDRGKREDERRRKHLSNVARSAAHGRGIASDILHDVIVVMKLPLTLIRALFSLPRLLVRRSRKADQS